MKDELMKPAIDFRRVLQKRDAVERARKSVNDHDYFVGVAEARFVLRRAFRIVEEQAKLAGIDPLAHQCLIQIFGSRGMELPINQIAERLDIAPAFASSLVKSLVTAGFASRRGDKIDQRVTLISVTDAGRRLLNKIDEQVHFHVDYFTQQLSLSQKENALSILLFYVGLSSKGER